MNYTTKKKSIDKIELHNDWEIKALKELCEIYYGKEQKSVVSENGQYDIYGTGGIVGRATQFIYDKPSILIGRKGTIDVPILITDPFWAIDTTYYTKMKNNVSIHWLFFKLLSIGLRRYNEASGVPSLSRENLYKIKLPVPPLPEQKAIAHLLGLMDTAINKNNQLIAQKELRKKWLMQNLLTGKKRLRGFKDEWKDIKIKDTFEFLNSYSIPRDGLIRESSKALIFCIHYGDIHAFYENEFLDFKTQKNIPQIIDRKKNLNKEDYLNEGDVIMVDASEDYEGVGEAIEVKNLLGKIAVGGLHTIVLRGNSKIIAKGFRGYFFAGEVIRNALRKVATGTSVYSITKTNMKNLSFKIPDSLKEQTAIANLLQAADKEIQLLKTKTEKLREQKKWLMQVLLTGKKRLKI